MTLPRRNSIRLLGDLNWKQVTRNCICDSQQGLVGVSLTLQYVIVPLYQHTKDMHRGNQLFRVRSTVVSEEASTPTHVRT